MDVAIQVLLFTLCVINRVGVDVSLLEGRRTLIRLQGRFVETYSRTP